MDPSLAPQPPDQAQVVALLAILEHAIKTSRNIFYAGLAAYTVLLFDWMLTLDSEIASIWKAKWNYTKVLYLLCRYFHFIDFPLFVRYLSTNTLSASQCKTVYEVGTSVFMAGVVCAELILTIRTWAVWAKGNYVAIGLFGSFLLIWAAVVVLAAFYLRASNHLSSPLPSLLGCIIEGSGTYLASIFVVIAAHDTIMVVLMITRGIYALRSGGDSRLLKTVYGDGIAFYVYLFVLSVVNIAIIFNFSELVVLLVMMQGAIHSVLACRVVLHIRQHYRPELEDSTWEMGVQSAPRFRVGTGDNLGLSRSQTMVWQPLQQSRHHFQHEPDIQELS
ncbi:hypothetical protein AGABI2DRAFT_180157 [Agaricus bisporus var. bisporus H97]|uniref:hypothetical protein n=1 Tax=Agaricus bisporus var. bisporus (strain H97 / ATCC MYA-4626 / FGSC 10389) TaxID=936046 RepID=UPI00029F70F9|nr:hypothetical protein AGABI2DRAFT_180157 [Agaricus bisporus var. bisporus H97]EKV44723.1 hypothetical protein AGABI2DRAFT_180157 [Agaricus bisporus var. bisporus H97]